MRLVRQKLTRECGFSNAMGAGVDDAQRFAHAAHFMDVLLETSSFSADWIGGQLRSSNGSGAIAASSPGVRFIRIYPHPSSATQPSPFAPWGALPTNLRLPAMTPFALRGL